MIKNPIAIIDIGSNSIRMVVYDGLYRSPAILFNERVLAELGKTLSTTGTLNPKTLELAFSNLQRFKAVISNMNAKYYVIATAALREASDGPAFTQRLKDELGLDIQIISGEQEAYLGAMGLLASVRDVDGVAGDLGGGSLEFSHMGDHQYIQGASTPLGGLRLASGYKDKNILKGEISKNLNNVSWLKNVAKGKTFYAIGGAWRGIARYYMEKTAYPIHIIHGLRVPVHIIIPHLTELTEMNKGELMRLEMISKHRRPVIGTAAQLLLDVINHVGASELVFSGFGVRDGLLFTKLDAESQAKDPLMDRCKQIEKQLSRFNNGKAIYKWSKVIVANEKKKYQRLYKAACMINDMGWFEHRDYRAELSFRRVLTQRLGGGVNHVERVMLAIAIYVSYGENINDKLLIDYQELLTKKQLKLARRYGLAIRLARRLGGGPVKPLKHAELTVTNKNLELKIDESLEPFMGQHIEKLLDKLADNMELKHIY